MRRRGSVVFSREWAFKSSCCGGVVNAVMSPCEQRWTMRTARGGGWSAWMRWPHWRSSSLTWRNSKKTENTFDFCDSDSEVLFRYPLKRSISVWYYRFVPLRQLVYTTDSDSIYLSARLEPIPAVIGWEARCIPVFLLPGFGYPNTGNPTKQFTGVLPSGGFNPEFSKLAVCCCISCGKKYSRL